MIRSPLSNSWRQSYFGSPLEAVVIAILTLTPIERVDATEASGTSVPRHAFKMRAGQALDNMLKVQEMHWVK